MPLGYLIFAGLIALAFVAADTKPTDADREAAYALARASWKHIREQYGIDAATGKPYLPAWINLMAPHQNRIEKVALKHVMSAKKVGEGEVAMVSDQEILRVIDDAFNRRAVGAGVA